MKGTKERGGQELETRIGGVCRAAESRRRWTLGRLCDELGLVVDLQRLFREHPLTYQELLDGRRLALALWLFELAIACACHGLCDFAPTLLGALPGVDGRALSTLLEQTLKTSRPPRAAGVAVGGGAR